MIEVHALEPAGEPAWEKFLHERPGALVYHSLAYRDLLLDHLGCEAEYLVAMADDELRGVLPAMWAESGDGAVLNSLPYHGSNGSVLAESAEAAQALIHAWNERALAAGTLAATMVSNPLLQEHSPAPSHNLEDVRISQVTRLPDHATEEAVMQLIDSSARRNVRKARKSGTEVERDHEQIGALCRIHQQNIRALGGLPKSVDFFDAIGRHFKPGDDYEVWLAREDGDVVAGLLAFYFNGVCEYFTPAVDHDHRSDQPLAAILVEAMTDAVARGCRSWNWGATWETQESVYRFKRKWGAAEKRYRYYTQLNDGRVLDREPAELRERFPHFYVVPFASLREKGDPK